MAKTNAHLLAFNRGEVSKIALARIDQAKLQLATEVQVNWMPFALGPAMLRPGLKFIGEIAGDNPCALIDFIYSATDTALLELTDSTLRVWINDALISRVAVGTVVLDPNMSGSGSHWTTSDTTAGCTATVTGGVATLTATARGGLARIKQTLTIASGDQNKEHGLRVVVTNGPVTIRVGSAAGLSDYLSQTVIDTGTHSLAFTPTSTSAFLQIDSTDTWIKTLTSVSIEPAGVLTVPTPWAVTDLPNVRWAQSKDVIFLAAYGKQQYKIERRGTRPGARGWSVVLYRSGNGPFFEAPTITCNLTPSVMSGNGTLSSDQPFFEPGHVGALFQLFTSGQTNAAVLGALNAVTEPVRVVGVGTAARDYSWQVAGTFVGLVSLERSFDGPDFGFASVLSGAPTWAIGYGAETAGFTVGQGVEGTTSHAVGTITADNNSGSTGTLTLDNVTGVFIVGEILQQAGGFGTGSGSATVTAVQQTNAQQATAPGGIASLSGTADTPDLDNVIAWERLRFAQYTSGSVTVSSGYGGGGRNGICRVTGYTSPTQVSIEVLEDFSSLAPTQNWAESAWSGVQGWPSSVCFQEDRLWWFGASALPINGSQSNNYTGFAEEDVNLNDLGDAGAILEDFGDGPSDRVNWGLGLSRLLCGRERSISSIRSSSFDTPLTPDDFAVKDCSEQGAARIMAAKVGKRGIFVCQSGDRVYQLFFNPQLADYDDDNLTRYNLDIAKPGLVDITVATQPDTTVYFPRADGQVACFLFDPNDDVQAWWRIMTLGVVENARALPIAPSSGGGDDRVYFCVRRTVNGATKRFLERTTLRSNNVGGLASFLLDCNVRAQGSGLTSITLAQLPNTLVSVWADGAFIGTGTTNGAGVLSPLPDNQSHSQIVAGLAGGQVSYYGDPVTTMPVPAAYNGLPGEFFADQQPSQRMIYVGTLTPQGGVVTLPNGWQACSIVGFFGFMAPLMSAKLAYGAQLGTPLSQKKKLDSVGLIAFDMAAEALQFGQRFDALDPLPSVEDDGDVNADGVWSEYDQPAVDLGAEWDTDARLCLLGQAPLPATLGALVLGVTTKG